MLPALPSPAGLSPAPSSYLDEPVLPALAAVLRDTWPFPPDRLAIFDGAMDAIDHVSTGPVTPR